MITRLGDLLRDPELRRQVLAANRQRVAETFGSTTMIRHYESLYTRLLHHPAAASE